MSKLDQFALVGDHAEYRPTGHVSLREAEQLVASAIALAREQHVRKLLVVTTGLTGFDSPSLARRYYFVHEWARAAQGMVRIAMVARPEMIDPRKFGVIVAGNAGLVADVFAAEEEALAWLQRSQ